MSNIIENPYFTKIILTLIAIIIKIIIDVIIKPENDFKGLQKLTLLIIYYLVPILVIIWLNLDDKIDNSKYTTTLIVLNLGFFIFNFFQERLNEQYKIVSKFGKIEKEKIKEINIINNTQAEKMKGIVNNQNYILNELSKINDRIIKYIFETKK